MAKRKSRLVPLQDFDLQAYLSVPEGEYGSNPIAPRVRCKDGFEVSVQASKAHYCEPRNNRGPWYKFELGFPSKRDEGLMSYAETPESPCRTVYGYVPFDVVLDLFDRHGGVVKQRVYKEETDE